MGLAWLGAEAAAVLLVLPRIGLIDHSRSTVAVEIDQSSLVEQAGIEAGIDISGCRVCASRDLTRKMGRDELLDRRCIVRCLLTPHTPMLLFICCFSFPSIFENYSVRGAAGFENILIFTTIGCLCVNRGAWSFQISSEK